MNKVVSTFLDRLAERFAALMAGLLSSRVEGLHAAAQAEQQSELEDLARSYEADGKHEIAQTLRGRALRLTSTNLAAEAVEVIQQTSEAGRPVVTAERPVVNGDLRGLPSFDTNRPAKKRRLPEAGEGAFPTPEDRV
jgi:hypothetical protein